MDKLQIKEANGKLGVLVVGMNGAVSSTFIAGTIAIRRGYSQPVGSVTQMQTIRIGARINNEFPMIKDFVPLANLDDIVFGGWDIRDENLFESLQSNAVLEERDYINIKDELENIKPMPGVFDQAYVHNLEGEYIKSASTKYDLAEQLRNDIQNFKINNELDRLVVIWCGSTEVFLSKSEVHNSIHRFEQAMKDNHEDISPSMLYAWAAIKEGVPYINGAPNLTIDVPALEELAIENSVPICGKDFKTGQTMLKTVIAPMLKARMLGLNGWFSSNILGNRDGEVLDDPESFKTKEESKLSVIESIIQPDVYPDLYDNYYHKVRINYYPPRGDNKESWDNIDIFGWMGYQMSLKINFLCRDSILAAPICLDLVLLNDLASRAGMKGIQEWLSFYFKSPMHKKNVVPENDLFIQLMKMKNTLRKMMGEEVITHLDSNGHSV